MHRTQGRIIQGRGNLVTTLGYLKRVKSEKSSNGGTVERWLCSAVSGPRCPSGPSAASNMQLSHLQTLMAGGEGINKVTAMCFSPNDKRLAVCLLDRIVYLYDENGERREKFSTKPGDKVCDRHFY